MKILIYGANGWIGSQFTKILDDYKIEYYNGKSRVDNENDLKQEIELITPTHIVSLIGRTHGVIDNVKYSTIDYLEQKGKLVENIRDNLYSPLLLAVICKEKNIHFTYLGTGCIFNYSNDKGSFDENDKPNFFGSSYSVVKGFTDRLMHLYNILNLRIRMPITGEKNPRNFITKITTYDKICSMANSMSVLPELLPLVIDMMHRGLTGTINLTNPGTISHNEILEMYRDIVDPSFTWQNFSYEEQAKILASDRSNNELDTTKLQSLYPNVKHIKDSVKECLISYSRIENKMGKMNLLVTGGCGFIGSNFINKYFYNSEVNLLVNIDAMYYCANRDNINNDIRRSDKYKFIEGSICNRELVENILLQYNITHVIHFAAQSHVQNSFKDSIKFTQDNILGTHLLLDACKGRDLKKIIHVSTDEVYGESMNDVDEQKKTEHSILCPTNPYAATKASAELIAQSYMHSYKLPIIITRSNNVYGKNQYPEKVIPLFIKLLKENKRITIHGRGETVRSFIYISDVVSAFETILEHGVIGEIYNIGCNDGMEYSVLDVAKLLIKMIKKTEEYDKWIEFVEDRPFNDRRYYISNNKLKALGWDCKVDINKGLEQLLESYRLRYYLIHNLDKSRAETMNAEFEKWGFDTNNITWINHPNKNELSDELIKKILIQSPSITNGLLTSPTYLMERKGYISCTYKHYLALKDIVENNYDYGVIMEDNNTFTNEIPKLVPIYIEQLDKYYGEWDILFDACWTNYIESPVREGLYVYPKSNAITAQCHGGSKAANFYLIKQECARKLLPHYIPFNHSPDWWMNDLFRKLDIKSFWVEPSFVKKHDKPSTCNTLE